MKTFDEEGGDRWGGVIYGVVLDFFFSFVGVNEEGFGWIWSTNEST